MLKKACRYKFVPKDPMPETSERTKPAMLTTREAAEYVGTSVPRFRREIAMGIWPDAYVKKTLPHRWRRAELDAVLYPESFLPQDRNQKAIDDLDKEMGLK